MMTWLQRKFDSIGSVYIARGPFKGIDLIKIGFARDVTRRLYQIRSDWPGTVLLAAAPGGELEEWLCHRSLDKSRYALEWFHPADEVLAFVSHVRVERALPEIILSAARDLRESAALAASAMDRVRAA